MKVYLATPVGNVNSQERRLAMQAKGILQRKGLDVYCPWEMKIPHAWSYPNYEWGAFVFANDVTALNQADIVILLSYGRMSPAGASWEAGYAYGIGKPILVVEMRYPEIMSIMVSNGCYARTIGLEGLSSYDFGKMPMLRTYTEQV